MGRSLRFLSSFREDVHQLLDLIGRCVRLDDLGPAVPPRLPVRSMGMAIASRESGLLPTVLFLLDRGMVLPSDVGEVN